MLLEERDWRELPIAVIDFETTGLSPKKDRAVELAIVTFVGGDVVARKSWLIYPLMKIPEGARAIHGITDEMVARAPAFSAIAEEAAVTMSLKVPCAFNAPFDHGFWCSEFGESFAPRSAFERVSDVENWIDPLIWARHFQSAEKGHRLVDVCSRLPIKLATAHRAEADAEAAGRVLFSLDENYNLPDTLGELLTEQARLRKSLGAYRRAPVSQEGA
jgi:DNA polymerase III subunit epsilon